MNNDIVLKDFGNLLGIDLVFDQNGQCMLELDSTLLVSIRKKEENYIFYGMLGEFPDETDDMFWKNVLAANIHLAESPSGSICFEMSTDCLVLIKSIRTFQLEAVGLKKALEDFVETQEGLLELFTQQDDVAHLDDRAHRVVDGQTGELRRATDTDRHFIRV